MKRRKGKEEVVESIEDTVSVESDDFSFGGFEDSSELDDFEPLDSFSTEEFEEEEDERSAAIENNAEIEILDVFEVDHGKKKMDVSDLMQVDEPETEELVEEETPKIVEKPVVLPAENIVYKMQNEEKSSNAIVAERLKSIKDVAVKYVNGSVPSVSVENGVMHLGNYRVYVNGALQKWDHFFEVLVKEGDKVEMETGVSFEIPDGYNLVIDVPEEKKAKYSLDFEQVILDNRSANQELIVTLKAKNGAYLSKVGRVIECQLLET